MRESQRISGKTAPVMTSQGIRPAPGAPLRRDRVRELWIWLPAIALLGWGWATRGDAWLGPQGWPGWLAGLAGALMMLATMGHAWRKRQPGARAAVGWWYHAHVVLGLIGPVLVLIHARFAWRSINAGFALWAMIAVVLSGVIGRHALGPARRRGLWPADLWHYLHVPLFAVLAGAVIVHVYMAHAY